MNKTVMLIGVFEKGSTNISQAKAFMEKDYKVIPISYRTVINNYGIDYFNKLLLYTIDKEKPNLVLFSKCNGISSEIVKTCSNRTKTFLWNMDHQTTIQTVPEVIEHAKVATFASCTSPSTAKWFEEQGVKKCYHIFEGIDPHIIKPVESVSEYEADISFIGTKTPERDMYRDSLTKAGFNVKFYGNGYDKEVIDEEFAKVCSSSKYMLSLNVHNNEPEYFSDRVFRYLGCGACTFHLDNTGPLNKWFKDGKDIVYFREINDLILKLSVTNEEIAKRIGKSGRRKVLAKYTWSDSINQILSIIK
jgi:spore maturation protein CgeB